MRRVLLSVPAAVIGAAVFIVVGTAIWANFINGPHRPFGIAASTAGMFLGCAYLGIAVNLHQRRR